jgi:hypothetical protein
MDNVTFLTHVQYNLQQPLMRNNLLRVVVDSPLLGKIFRQHRSTPSPFFLPCGNQKILR